MRILFLGTGTSHGVPVIGCACPACSSRDPRDRRFRSSLYLEEGGTALMIDAGPELRLQALRAGISQLDALLLTHAHADHIHGLDDLRPLTRGRPLPVYGNAAALDELRERFSYAFREGQEGGGKPRFELFECATEGFSVQRPGGTFLRIQPVPVLHGVLPILGFRIGDLAYLSDCSTIPDSSLGLLEGIKVLIVDGLRIRPHPTHFSLEEAIAAAERIGVRETWITHLTHDHPHAEVEEFCRRRGAAVGARPAWDGLELEL